MLGRIEGRRRRGWQRMRWLDGITSSMECGDGQGSLVCYSPRGCKESDMTEWLNWTELREHFPWEKGPGCTILIPTDPGRLLRGNESSWQCREHRRRGLDLGGEDPREKEMATHFSILACEIPWTEEPGKLQSMDLQMSWTECSDWVSTHRQGQRTEGNTGSWNTSPSVQLKMRIS